MMAPAAGLMHVVNPRSPQGNDSPPPFPFEPASPEPASPESATSLYAREYAAKLKRSAGASMFYYQDQNGEQIMSNGHDLFLLNAPKEQKPGKVLLSTGHAMARCSLLTSRMEHSELPISPCRPLHPSTAIAPAPARLPFLSRQLEARLGRLGAALPSSIHARSQSRALRLHPALPDLPRPELPLAPQQQPRLCPQPRRCLRPSRLCVLGPDTFSSRTASQRVSAVLSLAPRPDLWPFCHSFSSLCAG